jgi:hypothetical protein
MDLVAIKSLVYASKRHEVGESFEANNRDGRILIAIGKARTAESSEPVAEPVVAEPIDDGEAKPSKRAYRRRDMTAEKSGG